MIGALGINIKLLYTLVFRARRAWPASPDHAGADSHGSDRMGENILILAFVIIVIGGIGSIRGCVPGPRSSSG